MLVQFNRTPVRKELVSPCKGCEFRHVGCHGKCKFYNKWIDEREAMRRQVYSKMNADAEYLDYIANK